MIPNPTLTNMMAQAHQKDLLCEAEQQRLLALLPQQSMSRQVAEKLVMWLKQFGRSHHEFNATPLLPTKACLDQTDSQGTAR